MNGQHIGSYDQIARLPSHPEGISELGRKDQAGGYLGITAAVVVGLSLAHTIRSLPVQSHITTAWVIHQQTLAAMETMECGLAPQRMAIRSLSKRK